MKQKHSTAHVLLLMLVAVTLGMCEASSQGKGSIQVVAPPKVAVLLDGEFQGKTDADDGNLLLKEIPSGSHRVQALKPACVPQDTTLQVEEGQVATFSVGEFLPAPLPDDKMPASDYVAVDTEPEIESRVDPEYPPEALNQGLEGKVFVKLWIDKEGRARDVFILKSDNAIFNAAAIAAATKWHFTPALINDNPVPVWVSIPFRFKLSR